MKPLVLSQIMLMRVTTKSAVAWSTILGKKIQLPAFRSKSK